MFKLEQRKTNFINRVNKTNFNSIVIPTLLQVPVLKTKPILIQNKTSNRSNFPITPKLTKPQYIMKEKPKQNIKNKIEYKVNILHK